MKLSKFVKVPAKAPDPAIGGFRLSKKLYRKLKTKSCTKWKGSLWEGAPDEVG